MVIQQSSLFPGFLKYTTLLAFSLVVLNPFLASVLWASPPITVPVGDEPEVVAIDPNTNQGIVGHKDSEDLYVIDLSTNLVSSVISLNSRPSGVAINSSNNTALVSLEKLDR